MDPETSSAEREAAAQAANIETDIPAPQTEQQPQELNEDDNTYVITAEDQKAAGWYGELQKAGMARILKPDEEGPDEKEDPKYGWEQVRANQEAILQQFADKFNAKAVRETSYFFDDIADMEPAQVEAEVVAQREQLTSKLDSLDKKIDRINFRLEDPGTRFNLDKIDGRQELKEQFRIFEQLMREKAMAQERLSALDKQHEQYKSQQRVKQLDAEQDTRLAEAAQKAGMEVPADLDTTNTSAPENQARDENIPGLETPYILNEKDILQLDADYNRWFKKHVDDVPQKLDYHLKAQLSIVEHDLSRVRLRVESSQKSVDLYLDKTKSRDRHEKEYSRLALEDARERLAENTLQARYLEAVIPWLENKISEFKQQNAEYWRHKAEEMRQISVYRADAAKAEAYSHYWETANPGD